MSDAQPSFLVENAGKRVGQHTLLADIDLSIGSGEKVALIGPSGAGKTTLLRLLAGVLWPTTGRIKSLGHDTRELRGRALTDLRRRIGFMYQNDNLIPGLRVVHNVLMGRLGSTSFLRALWSLIVPGKLDEARRALAAVELEDRLWSLPGTLSGGEQQRVAIARILAQAPQAILADEPVSAVDVRLGREVLDTLTGLAEERGSTLVVSLHDLTMVTDRFDRVIALRDGELAFDLRPEDLDRELLAELYGAEIHALADTALPAEAPR